MGSLAREVEDRLAVPALEEAQRERDAVERDRGGILQGFSALGR